MLLNSVRTVVFDCDGVILDSNRLKTEAFFTVSKRFGEQAASELVDYHKANGGISRFRKFEYLLGNILQRETNTQTVSELSRDYGEEVYERLLGCQIADDLHLLRNQTAKQTWMVVSGGAESELNRVFKQRQLLELFDGGVYGSPSTKDEILAREISSGRLQMPAVFLGDSRYDHEAATRAGLDFVFISDWTEFSQWRDYCDELDIRAVDSISQLLKVF